MHCGANSRYRKVLTTGLVWRVIIYAFKVYILIVTTVAFWFGIWMYAIVLACGGSLLQGLWVFALVAVVTLVVPIGTIASHLRHLSSELPKAIRLRLTAPFDRKALVCATFEDNASAEHWLEQFGGESLESRSGEFEAIRRRPWLAGTTQKARESSLLPGRKGWFDSTKLAAHRELARLGFDWYYFAGLNGNKIWLYTAPLSEPEATCTGIPELHKSAVSLLLGKWRNEAETSRKGGYAERRFRQVLPTWTATVVFLQAIYRDVMVLEAVTPAQPAANSITTFTWCDVTHHQAEMLSWLLDAQSVNEVHLFKPIGYSPSYAGRLESPGRFHHYFPFALTQAYYTMPTQRYCGSGEVAQGNLCNC